ncbi:MAG: T9SS type A sorting domain-containing protein [Bacteroidota bacterium]
MKKTTLLFLLVTTPYFNFAQIGFNKNILASDTNTADAPSAIESADIDGDGDLDIIVSLYGDGFAWYENLDGQGNYGAQNLIEETNTGPRSIHAADIDGDGDLDIIGGLGFFTNTGLLWYENLDGQGNFGPRQDIITNIGRVQSVYAADMDSDGDLDVLSTSYVSSGGNVVAWYENLDGQGSFGSQQTISTYTRPEMVRTADMDNDGDQDVVFCIGGNTGVVAWLENLDGQGNFGSPQNIAVYSGDGFEQVRLTDIDNDGYTDVVYVYSTITAWNKNLGNGSFSGNQVIFSGSNLTLSVNTGDVDGDGDMDVFSSSTNNQIVWFENLDGLGNFGGEQVFATNIVEVIDLGAADIDNDGDVDIFSVAFDFDRISLHENLDGQGSFDAPSAISKSTDNPKKVIISDVNGDQKPDIIAYSTRDDEISWFPNDDDTNFENQKIISTFGLNGTTSPDFINVIATDVDSDNDIDVVGIMENKIVWFENLDGQGNFSTEKSIFINTNNLNSFAPIDIDIDGDIDFLSIATNGKITLSRNDGTEVFTQEILFDISRDLYSLALADVDDDGDIDIVFSETLFFFGANISYLENTDGLGNFSSTQTAIISYLNTNNSEYERIDAIYPFDLDTDGNLDFVAVVDNTYTFSGNRKLVWFKNNNGTFGSEQLITDDEVEFARFGDIDNDGDIDIIADEDLLWYENLGNATAFNNGQTITDTNTNGIIDFRFGDLDADGDLDIALVKGPDETVWFENLGILGNQISGTITLDTNTNGCDASDLVLQNILVVSDNGTNSFATFSQNDGSYEIPVNEGDFTTTITSAVPNYLSINPASYTSNFTGLGNTDTADFCITATSTVDDLSVIIYPSINEPRPGFDTTYRIVYKNMGTTQATGNITFQFDDTKLQLLNSSETINSQTANTLTFNYANLNPFETKTIDLEFNVFAPPTTNIDDILLATATINPVTGDNTEDDNVFELEQLVIGSYDPNDISVLEGDEILIEDANKYLHYLIRFQNTGTASAINVRVENVLDANLDWTTIQLESLSHPGRVEITDGNIVNFIFDGINLPDSTSDEPNSHGFITYKIKPKSAIAIGDIIYNTADIYFDFNPPIITNTVATEIVAPLSITEFSTNNFSIYPNPTKDIVTIKGKEKINKLSVYDLHGRVLEEFTLTTSPTNGEIEMRNYEEGLYFLSIETDKGRYTHKIIKK